jgi:hypothetical protein
MLYQVTSAHVRKSPNWDHCVSSYQQVGWPKDKSRAKGVRLAALNREFLAADYRKQANAQGDVLGH